MEKKLGLFVTYIPLSIIGLTCIKLIAYYSYFNLPISEYLGLADIGFLIIGDIFVLGLFMLVLLYIIYFHALSKAFISKSSERLRLGFYSLYIAITIILFVISNSISREHYSAYWTIKVLVIIFLMFTTFHALEPKSSNDTKKIFSLTKLLTLVGFVQLILAIEEIGQIKAGKNLGTIIITEDSSYISTPENYYIGKTEKFAFIYNINDSSSLAIPIENIKIIKHKRHYIRTSLWSAFAR